MHLNYFTQNFLCGPAMAIFLITMIFSATTAKAAWTVRIQLILASRARPKFSPKFSGPF